MSKVGKKFKAAQKAVGDKPAIMLPEAVTAVVKNAFAKFDETVDVAMLLGVDPKHADQMVRGTVVLPHGTGKSKRVAVIAGGDKAREAQEAGADQVGAEDLVEKIQNGFLDFEALVATPDMMRLVGKLGKVLGPKGLMPNPKAGTVTMDVGKAVRDAKAGKLEYRTDRGANVHVAIGKKSFGERQLVENYAALLDEIMRAKPAAAKGRYIKGITLAGTMTPGIKVDPARTRG